jgi:hypothetical protein
MLLGLKELVSNFDVLRASNGILGVLLPGNQYAEMPVPNQSQILKFSPFGGPLLSDL